MYLSHQEFCYVVSYLSVVFTPGQLAFGYCFYGVDLDFPIEESISMIDAIVTFVAGFLLAWGNEQNRKLWIIFYVILIAICQIGYWMVLIYSLVKITIRIHYEFLLPAVWWKLFQMWGLIRVILRIIEIKREQSSSIQP